jgi:hypothetical protein
VQVSGIVDPALLTKRSWALTRGAECAAGDSEAARAASRTAPLSRTGFVSNQLLDPCSLRLSAAKRSRRRATVCWWLQAPDQGVGST